MKMSIQKIAGILTKPNNIALTGGKEVFQAFEALAEYKETFEHLYQIGETVIYKDGDKRVQFEVEAVEKASGNIASYLLVAQLNKNRSVHTTEENIMTIQKYLEDQKPKITPQPFNNEASAKVLRERGYLVIEPQESNKELIQSIVEILRTL